jgi:hypothetical protein
LLLPKLKLVVGELSPSSLTMLTGGIGAPLKSTFISIAAVSLQKELEIFPPA